MSTDENSFRKGTWQDGQWEPSDDDDAEGLPIRPGGAGLAEADLELLTLAARALGAARVEVVESENWVNLHFPDGQVVYGWNSLLHSDDTVHLIASLNLSLSVNHEEHREGKKSVVVMWDDPQNPDAGTADLDPDPRAAIKRAVTRAAAEIGKQHS
jgi:hypothetical protein